MFETKLAVFQILTTEILCTSFRVGPIVFAPYEICFIPVAISSTSLTRQWSSKNGWTPSLPILRCVTRLNPHGKLSVKSLMWEQLSDVERARGSIFQG